jgi:Sulfotransferase family
MSSPVYALFRSMLHETSARNEGAVFIDNDIRKRLLLGVFDAYYHEPAPGTVIFDTNRGWTTKLPALVELFPDAKVICCVRNPAWILDSVESLIRRNAFELSGIFSYESGGTVYSRVEGLASAAGMFGFAYNALREAIYGEQSDRLLIVRYESLVTNLLGTLGAIWISVPNPSPPSVLVKPPYPPSSATFRSPPPAPPPPPAITRGLLPGPMTKLPPPPPPLLDGELPPMPPTAISNTPPFASTKSPRISAPPPPCTRSTPVPLLPPWAPKAVIWYVPATGMVKSTIAPLKRKVVAEAVGAAAISASSDALVSRNRFMFSPLLIERRRRKRGRTPIRRAISTALLLSLKGLSKLN